ncbi:MAG: MBL fold metallo-hydrolase [candidate division WOR-3 bacterium]
MPRNQCPGDNNRKRKFFWPLDLASYFFCLLLSFACSQRRDLALMIYFIDVGHGDCILIQTPDDGIKNNLTNEGLNILIDGGEEVMGREILLPFLWRHKIDTIDCLIATHFHSDHIGGLISVLENFPVKMVLTNAQKKEGELNRRFLETVAKENCLWRIARANDTIFWGKEMEVFILNPKELDKEENNNSIVLKIEYQGKGLLLTGDIEGKKKGEEPKNCKFTERRLIIEYKEILHSHVLKVSHHGSETSSTDEFLSLVSPKMAIITAGRKRFGNSILPDSSVILRLLKFGAKVYRTDFEDTSYKTAPGDDHILIKISPEGEITAHYLTRLIF